MAKVKERAIFITTSDKKRLRRIADSARQSIHADPRNLEMLERELDRANVVEVAQIPLDVVTMHSRAQILDLDSGQVAIYTLVFPDEADISRNRISILAPLGTAILGYRVGDVIEWKVPGGTRRLKVKRVIYQPETAASAPGSDRPWNFPLETGSRI